MTALSESDHSADVVASVARARDEIVDLCARLVAAPSVNPPGDTREVADVVLAAVTAGLDGRGSGPRLVRRVDPMPSVVAELDSGRPGPHLVLNVHMDTMPAGDETAWTVPVLELTRRDGRLYGLGMGNMKGAVAAMIVALREIANRLDAWCGRITFTAVSDEVVFGDNGSAHLLREFPDLYADGLLCGEGPGFRRLAVGEKGVLWLRITAFAAGGHSSAVQRGRSAAARIAGAVLAVDELTGRRGTLPPELAELSGYGLAEELTLTANVGTVAAGTFVGQIAREGVAEVDLRLPPGIGLADAEALVRAAAAPFDVQVARIKGWEPNWTSPRAALTAAFQRAHESIDGEPARLAVRLPASDASRWRAHSIPALCFGPQPTLSAGVDDHAEEDEVLRCAALYTLTALRFLDPASPGGPAPKDGAAR